MIVLPPQRLLHETPIQIRAEAWSWLSVDREAAVRTLVEAATRSYTAAEAVGESHAPIEGAAGWRHGATRCGS